MKFFQIINNFYQDLVRAGEPNQKIKASEIATLVTIPLTIILLLRLGMRGSFFNFFGRTDFVSHLSASEKMIAAQAYMSICTFLYLMIIPIIVHKLFPLPIQNAYGFKIRGIGNHFQVSLLLIGIMTPVLWLSFKMSSLNSFYPIFKPTDMNEWIIYEFLYLLMFIPTEFFFRGLFLYRLEHFFQGRAIWIAVIGYAIGHVYKPMPEAIGSIFAGFILGVLSIRCRSIWPGVVVHTGVAFLADLFAMIETGYIHKIL